jgi:hypothetical protein
VSVAVIDDHLLGRLLTQSLDAADRRALRRADLFTTGCWYYRLCHAVRSDGIVGALSGPFEGLPGPVRAAAVSRLTALPDSVGLTSLRDLAPLMAELVERHPLNLMSLEVLAAATELGATVVMASSNRSQQLIGAFEATGIRYRRV